MKYNVYYGANELRKTNTSRHEAINHYNYIKEAAPKMEKKIHIYCPTNDFYVSDYFLPDFLNENSEFGKLMFEDGAQLLSKEGDNLYKWNKGGEIVLSTK